MSIRDANYLAERWGCKKSTIYDMARKKEIAAVRIRTLVRFTDEEIERYERDHMAPSNNAMGEVTK